MQALTINELYALARQHGIPSYRKYKKAELITLLQGPAPAPKKRGRKPKAAQEPAPEQASEKHSADNAEKPAAQQAEASAAPQPEPAPEQPEAERQQPASLSSVMIRCVHSL